MNYSEKTKTNFNYSYFEPNESKVLRVILSELLGKIIFDKIKFLKT